MKSIVKVVKRNHRPVGIVIATGKNKVGWAKCAEDDLFDERVGISVAIAAIDHPDIFPNRQTPPDFVKYIKKMKERSTRTKIFQ